MHSHPGFADGAGFVKARDGQLAERARHFVKGEDISASTSRASENSGIAVGVDHIIMGRFNGGLAVRAHKSSGRCKILRQATLAVLEFGSAFGKILALVDLPAKFADYAPAV